jgi:dUTP pyrophosphatase
MIVKYKKVRDGEPSFEPQKRDGDADFDLFSSSTVVIQPGNVLGIPTNIAIEFPEGFEGKIESKSGLALNKGITVLGGVIDNSYTGEIVIIVANLGKSNVSFMPGNKVAQLKFRECSPKISFEFTESNLKQTDRAGGGFGSTGV